MTTHEEDPEISRGVRMEAMVSRAEELRDDPRPGMRALAGVEAGHLKRLLELTGGESRWGCLLRRCDALLGTGR